MGDDETVGLRTGTIGSSWAIFFAVQGMKVRMHDVDPAIVERVNRFFEELGKIPVVLKLEVPGHIANRLAALWRVAIFSVMERHSATDENGKEKELAFRRVMRVTERTIDKKGQPLLIPEIELEG